MHISYIEKINNNKIRITLENSEEFTINEKEWHRFVDSSDVEIDNLVIENLFNDKLLPKAKLKAMNLLKSRDYSEKELFYKLKTAGFPEKVINQTMDYIRTFHYIDDQRFAENYIRFRGQVKSRKELRYELNMKGIDIRTLDNIDYSISEHDDLNIIITILKKRWGEYPRPELKEKERMTRYLARRGFCIEDVLSAYKELGI